MEYVEGIVGLIEMGVVPVLWYFYKRFQKNKAVIVKKDKEIQAKSDEIQDLKQLLHVKDLEIKLIENK